MVDIYGDFPNGYNNPNAQNAPAPAQTAREAAAIAGAQVGFRGSYANAYDDYQTLLNQQAQEKAAAAQEQAKATDVAQQRSALADYQQQAIAAASQRAGYAKDVGDRSTGVAVSQLNAQNAMLQMMGMPTVNVDSFTGNILEGQRQTEAARGNNQGAQFFLNEEQRWAERPIETMAAYHYLGNQAGVPIPSNPFANQADVSFAFLKGGSSPKDFTPAATAFNPNIKSALGLLPNGNGLQQTAWLAAKTGQIPNANFTPAIDYIGANAGNDGVYGNLFGGIKSAPAAVPKVTPDQLQQFHDGLTTVPKTQIAAVGKNIGGLPAPFISTVLPAPFISSLPKTTKIIDKSGMTNFATNLAIGGINFGITGDIGGVYNDFTHAIAADTTHAFMPNLDAVPTKITFTNNPIASRIFSGASGIGKQVYNDVRNDPIQDIVLAALPLGFKFGENAIGNGIARAAMSKLPVVSGVGRVLSTPAATTAGAAVKVGLAGIWGVQTGANIISAPDKSKAIGDAIYQVGMFGAGTGLASEYNPVPRTNDFQWMTLGGERKIPLSDKIMIRAGDAVNARFQTKGQATAIKDVSSEYLGKSATFVKPEVTNVAPDISRLTKVKPEFVDQINFARSQQPTVMYGSGTIESQLGKGKMADILRETALPSSDFDNFIQFPDKFKLDAGTATVAIDSHEFPSGYPYVGQTANSESPLGTYMFGNRYHVNPFPNEIATHNPIEMNEHLNVLFRKVSSAVRDDISDPLNKGYRLPKDLSRLTRTRNALNEVRMTRDGGKPVNSAFDRMLQQTVTYAKSNDQKTGKPVDITTDTLFNIRAGFENSGKDNIPDAQGVQRSSGAVASMSNFASKLGGIQSVSQKSSGIERLSNSFKFSGGKSTRSPLVSEISNSPSTKHSGKSAGSSRPSSSPSLSGIISVLRSPNRSPPSGTPRGSPSPSITSKPFTPSSPPSGKPSGSPSKVPSLNSIIPPSSPTSGKPSSPTSPPSTYNIGYTSSPPSTPPSLLSAFIPSGSSGGDFARPRRFTAFKELAPTWSPQQQALASLTGSYGGRKKGKQTQVTGTLRGITPLGRGRGKKK